ncbi:uncharacterized protein LOC110968508 isoform X7 [Acanthochromis polyacanthus]|uniref:uncharacterized protein LOC110968508 isoform X7 n=1 Tax=Acanthochromis polyacanthus TaxID=80966 RepID=UPI002234D91C|nr:uncharacterized protein LOC110968508 isoform X7 [Acanthochromis polyacanthus]
MGFVSLECQICLYRTLKMRDFKEHMKSSAHILKVKDVFPEDTIKTVGLPFIEFLYPSQRESNDPIVGVSFLTMCVFLDGGPSFYLCHTCEKTCAKGKILEHLSSEDHYFSYFNYTNPNALSFSWISGTDVTKNLYSEVTEETTKDAHLKLLHLPTNLIKELRTSTYSKVMDTLRENEKLLKLFEDTQPKRTTIQTYQRDSNRKYPLLGLQHIVECICVGSSEKSLFICTLCSLTVASHMIIQHVLSFNHVFCYFKAWHPSTLRSKERYCKYSTLFASGMLNLSKQAQQIHGTANTDVKTVSLEPDEFKLVDFTLYTAALKKLESITGSSLITDVTPGEKLESSIATLPSASRRILHCQDCRLNFNKIILYIRHLSQQIHRRNLVKYFGEVEALHHKAAEVCLGLCVYIKNCLARNEAAVGAHLVVTIITTQAVLDPVYLCFACQECFSQWGIGQHFTSRKHLIHTLLYQNPWRLPFGWEDDVEDGDLMFMAWDEEKAREPHQMKIFDIPHRILQSFIPLSYSKVVKELRLHYNLLRREVPSCQTYSKLQENKRFPLLGYQFLVRWFYDDGEAQQSGSLCLLCKRLLSDKEFYAHIFSREHVAAFLDHFHPGSLNSSTNSVEILLDLAKQAACIHPIRHVQVVPMDRLIREPCPYHILKDLLQGAKLRAGSGSLVPSILPQMKLVPGKTVQEGAKSHVSDNSQKSSSSNTTKLCVPSGQHQENKGGKTTPTPSAVQSEMKSEGVSSSEEMKTADKTCEAVKVMTEEPTVTKPSGGIPESSQSMDRDDGAETSESSKEVPAQRENGGYKEGERKRSSSMSEVAQKTTCPDEDVREEMARKRRRLTCTEDTVCENPPKVPNSEQKGVNAADMEKRQEVNKGSSTPLQCSCDQRKPNCLCEYCSLKSSETDVISHTAGFDDQGTYVVVDMEIDNSDDSQGAADVSAKIDTTFKATDAPPELKGNYTTTKVSEPADSSHTSVTVRRGSGDTFNPNVSTSGTNAASLCPDSTFNDCKAHITPKTSVALSKVTTTLKRADATGSTSNTTSTTKSAAVSRPPESRTEIAGTVKAASCSVASKIRPSVLQEATDRTAASSKAENPLKYSEAALPSEAHKTSVKCGKREASAKTVHVKHSEGGEYADDAPRLHKSNKLAAPHLTTATTDRKPPMKRTHSFGDKMEQKTDIPGIGLNQLILVFCEGKKQIYCQLCSVKLTESSRIHLTDRRHHLNYVKLCFPGHSQSMDQIQEAIKNLAQMEKKLNFRKIQEIKVNQDVYNELAALPVQKVLEKIKELKGKTYTQASSSFAAAPAETSKRDAAWASPCEVSSTDDGISMPQSEMSGLSTNNQTEQENKNKLQTPNSHVSKEASVAAARSARAQSFDGEETQADDSIQDQFRPSSRSSGNYSEPNPGPSIQPEEKQVVAREKLVSDRSQKTPDNTQQQRRISAELHATQKMLEGEKTEFCSRLSSYLKVKRLDTELIIGLGSVWECQGISQETFFLCESCSKMLSLRDICQHMVSSDHKLQCMWSNHNEIMRKLWPQDDVTKQVLEDTLWMISHMERKKVIDAQVVLLGHDMYEAVRTAPFSEALKMVKNIKNEKKMSPCCLQTSTYPQKNQQPEDRQSLEQSLPTEMKSAESLETNHADVFPTEASRTAEKTHLDETPNAEDLNGAKQRSVSSPLDVRRFSSEADSVVPPSPPAGTRLSPQEACSSLSVKQEFPSPPPPQLQSPPHPVKVKQEELHSETPSCAAPLSSKDNDTEHKSDQKKILIKDNALGKLIALVKAHQKKLSSCKFAPDPKDVSSESVSESMEENFDLRRVKTEFEVCDSPTTTGCENQVVPQANSASSASKSSSEDYVMRGNPLFGGTEVKTADQPSYAATNYNPRQILQPQGDTKPNMPGVSLLPINTIITDRPSSTKHKFMGSYKVENHFKMNTGQQVGLSPFQSANPSDTMAACGGYGQSSHSVYLPSQPVSGYTTPSNPVVHTGSLYQHQEYPTMQFYTNQLHPEQVVNPYGFQSFGTSLATPMPTGWGSLEMPLPHPQQQQLMQQQLQQLMQQQITKEQEIQQLRLQVQQLQQQQREQPEQQQVQVQQQQVQVQQQQQQQVQVQQQQQQVQVQQQQQVQVQQQQQVQVQQQQQVQVQQQQQVQVQQQQQVQFQQQQVQFQQQVQQPLSWVYTWESCQ